jgi:hypothetical protein
VERRVAVQRRRSFDRRRPHTCLWRFAGRLTGITCKLPFDQGRLSGQAAFAACLPTRGRRRTCGRHTFRTTTAARSSGNAQSVSNAAAGRCLRDFKQQRPCTESLRWHNLLTEYNAFCAVTPQMRAACSDLPSAAAICASPSSAKRRLPVCCPAEIGNDCGIVKPNASAVLRLVTSDWEIAGLRAHQNSVR